MPRREKLTPRQKMDRRIESADLEELQDMLSHYLRHQGGEDLIAKIRDAIRKLENG